MVLSAILGLGSLLLPVVVPAWRELHDKPSFQWQADNSHPVSAVAATCCMCLLTLFGSLNLLFLQFLHSYAERDNRPDFHDAKSVVAYSKHGPYRFEEPLTRKS